MKPIPRIYKGQKNGVTEICVSGHWEDYNPNCDSRQSKWSIKKNGVIVFEFGFEKLNTAFPIGSSSTYQNILLPNGLSDLFNYMAANGHPVTIEDRIVITLSITNCNGATNTIPVEYCLQKGFNAVAVASITSQEKDNDVVVDSVQNDTVVQSASNDTEPTNADIIAVINNFALNIAKNQCCDEPTEYTIDDLKNCIDAQTEVINEQTESIVSVLNEVNESLQEISVAVNVNALGFSQEWMCRIADNKEVLIRTCKNSNGTFTTTDLESGAELSDSDISTLYKKECSDKTLIDTCLYRDDSNTSIPEKLRPLVWIDRYEINGAFCFVEANADPTDENNIINNIQNFEKMSYETRKRGQLAENSPIVVTPFPMPGTVTVCVGDTDVDAIPALLGSAPVTAYLAKLPALPTGLQYGVVSAKVTKLEGQKGATVDCDVTGATDQPLPTSANTQGTFTTPYDANNNILPGGESGIIAHATQAFEFIGQDADGKAVCVPCYDVACMLTDGDILLNNGSPNGAFDVTLCFACFGTPTANRESGDSK